MSWDASVIRVTSYELKGRRSIIDGGRKYFVINFSQVNSGNTQPPIQDVQTIIFSSKAVES